MRIIASPILSMKFINELEKEFEKRKPKLNKETIVYELQELLNVKLILELKVSAAKAEYDTSIYELIMIQNDDIYKVCQVEILTFNDNSVKYVFTSNCGNKSYQYIQ